MFAAACSWITAGLFARAVVVDLPGTALLRPLFNAFRVLWAAMLAR